MYFDHSATTPPDPRVLQTFTDASVRYFANPASLHQAGKQAEKLLETARRQLVETIGLDMADAVFTAGGTEANNLAIIGYAYANQHRGRHIITTAIEHPSVLEACRFLQQQGFTVDYLAVDEEGGISLEQLAQTLTNETILVSIMHINNEIGTVQPIADCAALIHSKTRAAFHSDCVQSFGRARIEGEDGPDLVTISAHKLNGIKGSGLLAFKKSVRLQPVSFGGGQEKNLRSGTVSVPHAAALAKAARLAVEEADSSKHAKWRSELIEFIKPFEECIVLAENAGAPHILSLAFRKINGEVAVNYLQEQGIIVSTSSACSSKSGGISHVIEAVGIDGAFKKGVIRISFGKQQTAEEIEQLKQAIANFIQLLRRGIGK